MLSPYTQAPMFGFKQTWSRQAVGYRQGELTENEAVASSVVIAIGGPIFLVGALMVVADGLSFGQVLLAAPIAALTGAFLIGWSARMAAQTGAAGSWLQRPAFGRHGSLLVAVVRLAMVLLWAAVGLDVAVGWAGEVAPLQPVVWLALIVILGLVLVGLGLVRVVRVVWRRAVFIASVLLLGVMAWRLAQAGGSSALSADGSFWSGLQRAVEVSVVLIPFVQLVSRRLHDERDALSSFGVSYAIPAALGMVAGALVALRLGAFPSQIAGLETGVVAIALAAAWLIVTELDQVFANFAAAGNEAAGILRVGPVAVVGLAAVLGVAAIAYTLGDIALGWASLATAVYLPAAIVAAVDFLWVHNGYYVEADIYGESTVEAGVNLTGLACWLGAVAAGQLLDPIGPEQWTGLGVSGLIDLPWRFIFAVAAGLVYLVASRWTSRRFASIYGLRGV